MRRKSEEGRWRYFTTHDPKRTNECSFVLASCWIPFLFHRYLDSEPRSIATERYHHPSSPHHLSAPAAPNENTPLPPDASPSLDYFHLTTPPFTHTPNLFKSSALPLPPPPPSLPPGLLIFPSPSPSLALVPVRGSTPTTQNVLSCSGPPVVSDSPGSAPFSPTKPARRSETTGETDASSGDDVKIAWSSG